MKQAFDKWIPRVIIVVNIFVSLPANLFFAWLSFHRGHWTEMGGCVAGASACIGVIPIFVYSGKRLEEASTCWAEAIVLYRGARELYAQKEGK